MSTQPVAERSGSVSGIVEAMEHARPRSDAPSRLIESRWRASLLAFCIFAAIICVIAFAHADRVATPGVARTWLTRSGPPERDQRRVIQKLDDASSFAPAAA